VVNRRGAWSLTLRVVRHKPGVAAPRHCASFDFVGKNIALTEIGWRTM
jgi:hypothetical protein